MVPLRRIDLVLTLVTFSLALWAAGPLEAADRQLTLWPSPRIIQLQMDSGSGPIVVKVLEGTPALIVDRRGPMPLRCAVVPKIVDDQAGHIELRVYRLDEEGQKLALGKLLETVPTQVGYTSFLVASGLLEVTPLGFLESKRETASAASRSAGRVPRLPSPEASLCCINMGGVTTCGCAVEQGGQSCCSGACCAI